jgi:hypothetical protein
LKGIGFDPHEMFFQQDGTQPHTANTDADTVNTYFRDGRTSNRLIPSLVSLEKGAFLAMSLDIKLCSYLF